MKGKCKLSREEQQKVLQLLRKKWRRNSCRLRELDKERRELESAMKDMVGPNARRPGKCSSLVLG